MTISVNPKDPRQVCIKSYTWYTLILPSHSVIINPLFVIFRHYSFSKAPTLLFPFFAVRVPGKFPMFTK